MAVTAGDAGDQVLIHLNCLRADRVAALSQSGGGDGGGDDDATIGAGGVQIVAQGHTRYMDIIGDEAEPERLGQAQGPLDNVVVAVQQHRAAVTEVSEHR